MTSAETTYRKPIIGLMLKNIFFFFLFFLCFETNAQTGFDYFKDYKPILEKVKDSGSNLAFTKLLARFKANDTTLTKYETLALLIGFTDQPEYRPYDDIDTEKDIFISNDNGNYEDASAEADSFLAAHPLSLRALKEKSYSLHQLKKADSSIYFLDLVHRIMLGMLFSGNGKTPETPIFALGLNDGERFIENMGMVVGNKGTGENKSHLYMEMVEGIGDDGDRQSMYFVIQHAKNKATGADKEDNNFKKGSKKNRKKDAKLKNKKEQDPSPKE